eukprot:gene20471-7130_t
MLLAASIIAAVSGAPNPNCESRGKCTAVGPGTKYPEQSTMCLADSGTGPGNNWHCAALSGKFGENDHSFGPGNTFDITFIGGSPVNPDPNYPDLNESFTVHATNSSQYGRCNPADGVQQWEITREYTYLNGSAAGECRTRILADGPSIGTKQRVLGSFTHPCEILTQITVAGDEEGMPQCLGCRCCTTCTGCACLPP